MLRLCNKNSGRDTSVTDASLPRRDIFTKGYAVSIWGGNCLIINHLCVRFR